MIAPGPCLTACLPGIHKRGGTVLGSSRGGANIPKIVDAIADRGINQVYIIGGDGTQRGSMAIFEEIKKRGLKCSVCGIPKVGEGGGGQEGTRRRGS